MNFYSIIKKIYFDSNLSQIIYIQHKKMCRQYCGKHTPDRYKLFCRGCHLPIKKCDEILPQPQLQLPPQQQPQPEPQPLPQPQPQLQLQLPPQLHHLFSLECKYCGKVLSGTTSLKAHERSHIKEKPFECRECGRPFGTNQNRIRHENTAHNIQSHMKEANFQCPNCVRRFTSEQFMVRHHTKCVGI